MLPITQASLVSRMRTDAPQIPADLQAWVSAEYAGDGAAVTAAILRARRAGRARMNGGKVGTVVRALTKISEALSAALTAPGGA